jgi:hypothetical protein
MNVVHNNKIPQLNQNEVNALRHESILRNPIQVILLHHKPLPKNSKYKLESFLWDVCALFAPPFSIDEVETGPLLKFTITQKMSRLLQGHRYI